MAGTVTVLARHVKVPLMAACVMLAVAAGLVVDGRQADTQSPLAAPTIDSITPGDGLLTVAWTAPARVTGIRAYDLRYIRSDASNKADGNWRVLSRVWEGSGDLTATVTGLTNGVRYDVQVRTLRAESGAWSATTTGTPLVPGPTTTLIAAGDGAVTVEWEPPNVAEGREITAYDVRYIATNADETDDANWTVEGEAWTSGPLRYLVTGLTNGASYDVQVRAVTTTDAAWSTTSAATPAEPGDERRSGATLTLNTWIGGIIDDDGDDVDYFTFVLTESTGMVIVTRGDLDTVGELQDSSGTVVAENDEGRVSHGVDNFLIVRTLPAGTYHIKVTSGGDTTGPYILQTRAIRDTTGRADAQAIELNTLANGIIDSYSDYDYFRFTLNERTTVMVRGFGAPLLSRIYDSDGDWVPSTSIPFPTGVARRVTLDRGVYYFVLDGYGTPENHDLYAVYVSVVAEPGSTRADAAALPLGRPVGGTIDPTTDTDYFRIELSESTHLGLYAVGIGLDIAGELLDSNGVSIDANLFSRRFGSFSFFFSLGGRLGVTLLDELDAGTYYLRVTRSADGTDPDTGTYAVLMTGDPFYARFFDECESIGAFLTDPLSGCQWHLKNTGQTDGTSGEDINIEGAWAVTQGAGSTVAVVDNGMDHEHEDLSANVDDTRNHDYTDNDDIFDPNYTHGTAMAGIVAARDNTLGVRGVAPRATIYGFNLLRYASDVNTADALTREMETTAVSTNSWGYRQSAGLNAAPRVWELAIERALTEGYGGKGVFFAWAAGNGARVGDNANFAGLENHYGVVAVCAVTDQGVRASYSEEGANLWICAPSGDDNEGRAEITTTANYNRYRDDAGGTSSATPQVAGAGALLRSANTNLTWRDLKLILAASARKNDASNAGWEQGALKYGSMTERYSFNHEYGFGVLDATAAVSLASGWTNVPALLSETRAWNGPAATIPDNGSLTRTITVGPEIEFIEFVEINVDFETDEFTPFEVELVSPAGAVSVIAPARLDEDYGCGFFGFFSCPLRESFRFGSARHLGESSEGVWTLRVTDRKSGGASGQLESWGITLYGHRSTPAAPAIDSLTPGTTSLTVDWSAPANIGKSSVTAYDLRHIRSDATNRAGSAWTLVEDVWTTGGGALRSTIASLTEDVLYDVQVRAVNSQGDGLWSHFATGIPEADEAPVIDSLTPGDRSIAIAWTAPSPGTGITSYDLRYIRSDAPSKADRLWTTRSRIWTSGTLEYTLGPSSNPLLNGVSYFLQVRAVSGTEAGEWSAIESATPRTVPGAPTINEPYEGALTYGDDQELTIEWTPPSNDGGSAISSYDVRYIKTAEDETVNANWTLDVGAWTSGELSHTISGLENGTEYDVQVRAANAAGGGAWSASVTGIPLAVPGVPSIDSVTGGYRTIEVEWSAPASDGGSRIWSYSIGFIRSDAPDKADNNWYERYFYAGPEDDPYPLKETITGLESNVSYDIRVAGSNLQGLGDWSSTSVATTDISDNTDLSSLDLSLVTLHDQSPPVEDSYVASTAHVDEEITIRAIPTDPSSTVTFRDDNSLPLTDVNEVDGYQLDLSVGENIIEVVVTAQDGTARTYTITLTRAALDTSLTPPASDAAPLESASALYDVTFQGAWTIDATPGGVPLNGGFTRPTGVAHNASVTFLESGEEASPGVEALAETGSTTTLGREFVAAGANAGRVFEANRPSIPATSSHTFSNVVLSADHPLLTVIAGIAPSHDWFVGVSGLSLLDAQGLWLVSHEVDLLPWDAGTEDGSDFSRLPDVDTNPRGVIHSISGDGEFSTEPIATLTFTRRAVGPYFPTSESGARSVAENTAAGQDIGLPVPATDPDIDDVLTYSLEGPNAAAFSIDRSSGQLRTRAALNHEFRSTYVVTVVARDNLGLTAKIDVTISVENVDEAGTASLFPVQPRVDTVLRGRLDDADGGLRQVNWTWERSPDQDTWTSFPVTGESYTPASSDIGMYIRARVSYADGEGSGKSAEASPAQMVGEAAPTPEFTVITLVSGLDIPWDLAFTPDGRMLFTERGGELSSRLPDGTIQTVAADFSDLFVSGEAGLMAIVVDPRFASNRRFYTCQTHTGGTAQVIAWIIDTTYTEAARIDDPLVGDIPAGPRHSGCRLRFGPSGYLWIATGDAASGATPQDLASLGGKVLRVDAATGEAPPGNPFSTRVYTYGHRNVQGLALRPRTSQMWSVEHGPTTDDEINLLTAGGNYGWDPFPGYNQSVPMTDLARFPDAVEAKWSSGDPTLATSGGTFLQGADWGPWSGRLAVATLKARSLHIFDFTSRGDFVSEVVVPEFDGAYGRLRTPMLGPDGALYLTTSNGSTDRIIKVAPSLPPAFPLPHGHAGGAREPAGIDRRRHGHGQRSRAAARDLRPQGARRLLLQHRQSRGRSGAGERTARLREPQFVRGHRHRQRPVRPERQRHAHHQRR